MKLRATVILLKSNKLKGSQRRAAAIFLMIATQVMADIVLNMLFSILLLKLCRYSPKGQALSNGIGGKTTKGLPIGVAIGVLVVSLLNDFLKAIE
eukprot:12051157-Ditylum_brightwellii.AAC.1